MGLIGQTGLIGRAGPTLALWEITSCRFCGGRLTMFWDAGPMRIVEFPKLGELPKKPIVPLQLVVCESCWLVQLKHSVDPSYLYEEFWYRSGTNEVMRAALKEVAVATTAEAELKAGDCVLDIGCNDCTLLQSYPIHGLN